jgi:hypothetical protein
MQAPELTGSKETFCRNRRDLIIIQAANSQALTQVVVHDFQMGKLTYDQILNNLLIMGNNDKI